MLRITIPHAGELSLSHLVCEVNGTLAVDGRLQDGVAGLVEHLRSELDIHLLTSDTHGSRSFEFWTPMADADRPEATCVAAA